MTDRLRFSLVIPAYNEEALLPRLLDTVEIARSCYRGGAEAIEVIIGDNASTDATPRIAAERGCRVAHVERRIIGAVRNGGAALARGEIICFTDADMQVHPETFNVIEDMLADSRTVGGNRRPNGAHVSGDRSGDGHDYSNGLAHGF